MAAADETEKMRSMRGRLSAYDSWARTEDRATRTWPGRKAALDRFDREVDPDGVLTPQERAKRAEWARKAHMQRMAMKSAAARRMLRRRRQVHPERGGQICPPLNGWSRRSR